MRIVALLLTAVFVGLWVYAVVDCVRRKEFCPVCGGGWRTKLFWLACLVTLNPVLALWYVLFARPRRGAESVSTLRRVLVVVPALCMVVFALLALRSARPRGFRVTRGENGALAREGGHAAHARGQAATIEANNNLNTSRSVTSGGRAFLMLGDIMVMAEAEDDLASNVAAGLTEALGRLSPVRRVQFVPLDGRPVERERGSDLYIRVSSQNVTRRRLPGRLKLSATIAVHAGQTPWESSRSYSTNCDPPLVRWQWGATLQHRSTTTGVIFGGGADSMAVANIVEQFREGLAKTFAELGKSHAMAPELGDAFYGTGTNVPDMGAPFLEWLGARLAIADSGLLCHRREAWTFESAQSPAEILNGIYEEMVELDWRKVSLDVGDHVSPYLRMTASDDSGIMVLWTPRMEELQPSVGPDAPDDNAPRQYVCEFRRHFTREEVRAALEEELGEEAPRLQVLSSFRWFLDEQGRARLLDLLRGGRATSGEDLLLQAELMNELGPEGKDEVLRVLRQAWVMATATGENSTLKSAADSLAKKCGDPELTKRKVEPAELESLGLPGAETGQPLAQTVVPGEKALVILAGDDRSGAVIGHAVLRPCAGRDAEGGHLELEVGLRNMTGSACWSGSGATADDKQPMWSGSAAMQGHRISATAVPAGDGRYTVTLERLQ